MTRSTLVLGLGISGVAAAKHILQTEDELTIYAGASSEKTKAAAQPFIEAGVPVVFDDEDVKGTYDLCVACPGIPQTGSFYASAAAASTELISEPEFAWRMSQRDWVCITGTNGKTTTTSLVTHVLNACKKDAVSCGNIGDTTIEAVENRRPNQYLVAEMSSYQLASTKDFAPRVSVLLNITPDHVKWHGSHEAYAQAKLKAFANMRRGTTAVICTAVPGWQELAGSLRSRGVRVLIVGEERGSGCLFERDGELFAKTSTAERRICKASSLKIKGEHNVINALAAAAVALDLGCKAEQVAEALCSFAPLEHRIEPAGEIDGVGFYNDSKATNVDATLVALTAFPQRPIVLLLGGRDKGTDLAPLVEACKGPVRTVITYGEGGQRFHDAFENSGIELLSAAGMRDAFDAARKVANAGDVVLLSPACASFDEFNSFEHRGEVFKQLVANLREA